MTPTLYRDSSSDARSNAQRNLSGRTHYADDSTLRFHYARILSAHATDNGLLFWIIESVALDMRNTSRGFRYVIFDLFGTVVGTRASLDDSFKTSDKARAAMRAELATLDSIALTRAAMERHARHTANDLKDLGATIAKLESAQ